MSVTVAGVADADILNDAKTPKDVVSYGMGPHQQAVDVKTGEKIREYNDRLPEGILPRCDVINRAAALYGELVIFGTLDGIAVALNEDTGKVARGDRRLPIMWWQA